MSVGVGRGVHDGGAAVTGDRDSLVRLRRGDPGVEAGSEIEAHIRSGDRVVRDVAHHDHELAERVGDPAGGSHELDPAGNRAVRGAGDTQAVGRTFRAHGRRQ